MALTDGLHHLAGLGVLLDAGLEEPWLELFALPALKNAAQRGVGLVFRGL
jgi:hypothetical protein